MKPPNLYCRYLQVKYHFFHRKNIAKAIPAITTAGLTLTGSMVGMSWPYYLSVAAGACHLSWQIITVQLNQRHDCLRKFVSNKWFGAIIFVGAVSSVVLQAGVK